MPTPDPDRWTIDQVADYLGVKPPSARGALSRWGVRAVDHRQEPGGRLHSLFDPAEVKQAAERRPGRGARTDLRT